MRYSTMRITVVWSFSVMALVFSEWLFQATKPSFLTRLTAFRKIEVLLHAGMMLTALWLVVFCLCWGIAKFLKRDFITKILYILPPVAIVSVMLLLMVDNFTNTVLGYNMGAAVGAWRLAYVVLFVSLFVEVFKRLDKLARRPLRLRLQYSFYGFAGLWIVFGVLSAAGPQRISPRLESIPVPQNAVDKPNIIILSTDGLNASSMSVYGYEKETTPFLKTLAGETRKYEDHFANASHTTGSIVALFTGRHPTRTRVLYRPDMLVGEDSFLHLPGILREYGYTNYDKSMKYYADPYDLNLRHAFHRANGRPERRGHPGCFLPVSLQIRYATDIYFMEQLANRITERLAHMVGVRDLGNPYFDVTHTGTENRLDEKTITDVVHFLRNTSGPFFLHVHLLGTHGPKFGPPERVFSAGMEQNSEWMTEFYDDAVLAFDRQVKTVFECLKNQRMLDNTIVVLTSDHGQKNSPLQPIPFIIRFPKGRFAGAVSGPTQQIDMAPTLLDYLEIPIPRWMDGRSLLSAGDKKAPVFGVYPVARGNPKNGWREIENYYPPYYSIGGVSVIHEGTWYGLSLKEKRFFCKPLKGGMNIFDGCDGQPAENMFTAIIRHLRDNHFDATPFVNLKPEVVPSSDG